MKNHIRVTEPSITKKEIYYVTKAVTESWGSHAYKYIKLFEEKFSKYIGVRYAIATSSCTGALHIALNSLNIKSGDEVIIPDITWAATAFAIRYTGATPIFADIKPDTWCIDPASIERNITKRTKAIIPVHLYGHPSDMKRIQGIARKHRLHVVEDAAESVGAEYFGKKTGSMGDFAAFSFHGTKTLTTGEGGILLTNNLELYKKAFHLSNMAKESSRIFCVDDIGLKYKMTDMQAALGLAQLSRINELSKKKMKIFSWYEKAFSSSKEIQINTTLKGCVNSLWMPTIIWSKNYRIEKERVMEELKNIFYIDSRPFFYPLSSLKPFKCKVHNPISYDISRRGINLPCGFSLTEADANRISSAVLKILNQYHE